jgi:CRP-like cAMP-binding protein
VPGGWWPVARSGDLVGYLDDAELTRLLAVTEAVTVEEGDSILGKGSPSRSLILVEEGELAVVEDSLGETVVLAVIGPGGVVGEVGFVDGEVRTHDVVAAGPARLRRLTRERLLELVRDDAPLFAKLTVSLAEILARRFRSAMKELEPVRAFAATLNEPMDLEEGGASFEELDEPIPADALAMIRELAKSAQKGVAAT